MNNRVLTDNLEITFSRSIALDENKECESVVVVHVEGWEVESHKSKSKSGKELVEELMRDPGLVERCRKKLAEHT